MLRILTLLLLFIALFGDEKFSTQSIELNGETHVYTTAVGSGEVSYIAYIKEGENRPITFAFNGGPGSSSVWLHMGAFGPRRILAPEEGQSIVPPYKIVDNLETILDLSDIVFIDPMGTGFSKCDSKDDEQKHYSIIGDIQAVGKFIRDYITEHKRWNSPKYIAGESYGTLRAAGLADYLHNEFGIYLHGVLFISPAIDFQTIVFNPDNPLPYFLFLPTYATTAWYHGRYDAETVEEAAEKAREFAYNTYAPALICRKCFDHEPIYEELAKLTGLPLNEIRSNQGRIRDDQFQYGLLADERKAVGRFDSRIVGYSRDPSDSLIMGIFSGGFHEYLRKELGCPSFYTIVSMDVNAKWNYLDYNPWGYPNLMNGLRAALKNNPNMKVFVGCGYFDLATPFAAAEYCFDHLEIPDVSVQIDYYEGGHMFYLNPSARTKFKQDLIRFYQRTP